MSGHRRRSRQSPDASSYSFVRYSRRHRSSTPISTKDDETDEPGHHHHHRRQSKRSSGSLSTGRSSPASSRLSWVILNVTGARRDDFPGDGDSSSALAMSRTSNGEMISVSFDLVEPPGISVLALAWPRGPSPAASTCPEVVAAHRDVVLFEMARAHLSPLEIGSAPVVDYFVYQASGDSSRPPFLLLLPARYDEERCFAGGPMQLFLRKDDTGIMSCGGDKEGSFVVAKLSVTQEQAGSPPAIQVIMFRSSSGGVWEAFKNLHVRGANGGRDLRWWHTDAVVPDYRGRFLIWLDYYRGMILMDMSSPNSPAPPRLRYVPLPVPTVGDPDDYDYYSSGRGCPADSRSVCATRSGIKFVSVDRQHRSDWGVGHASVLTWNHTFRVTTWSLMREDDDDYTWRRDGTMYEEEFWATVESGRKNHRFPRVPPEYPVVDIENPDAVCFQLKKNRYGFEEPTWVIEVDMRKKVLMAATVYSREKSSSDGDEHSINSARAACQDISFSTELPRYLHGGLTCKKTRHK